jgi:hypothetical protein
MKRWWKTRVTFTLVLISASVFTHSEKALGEETQPITINERTYKIDGFSRSIDPTATSACTSWNPYGTCIDFTTPEPKVMTIYNASATQWFFEQGKEFSINQVFYTYGNTASIQVIAKSINSLSLKITPIRESAATRDHYFYIRYSNKDYSADTLRFGVIIPKSAIPVMSANCPKQVNLVVNGTTTFQIQTNFPADLSFYMGFDRSYTNVVGPKYFAQLTYKDLIFESDSSKKNFSITAKSTVSNLIRDRLYLKFSSVLNNPHPMELSPMTCEIVLETKSDRTNSYSWAWGDGSKSTSKTFSKDNLRSAYIVIGYNEFDAKGKKLTVNNYLQPTQEINVEQFYDGEWERVSSLSFEDGSKGPGVWKVVDKNVLNFAAALDCFRNACSGTEKIRVRSQDGVLNQIFQITFGAGYFDFVISAPTQVIWGKTYTASIKANKPLSGTCNFSSYYRGTVDQGTSKLIGGKASRRVKFLWGEEKSTVVQLSVLCKSGPYTVDKSILIRAFRP